MVDAAKACHVSDLCNAKFAIYQEFLNLFDSFWNNVLFQGDALQFWKFLADQIIVKAELFGKQRWKQDLWIIADVRTKQVFNYRFRLINNSYLFFGNRLESIFPKKRFDFGEFDFAQLRIQWKFSQADFAYFMAQAGNTIFDDGYASFADHSFNEYFWIHAR